MLVQQMKMEKIGKVGIPVRYWGFPIEFLREGGLPNLGLGRRG